MKNKASSHLKSLVDDYLEQTFERFPEQASQAGLTQFDALIGNHCITDYQAQQALVRDTLEAVEAIPGTALDVEGWLDHRTFLSLLRTEQIFQGPLARWRNNPQIHAEAAIHAVFDLLVRHSENLKQVLPAVEARLARIPDVLAAAAECIKAPVPLWTHLTEETCKGSGEFFTSSEIELCPISPHPEHTRQLLQGAARAFHSYATQVSRKKQGAPGGFAVGLHHFETLLRERLGFDCSLSEIIAQGKLLVEQCQAALQTEARKLGRRSAQELLEHAAQEWHPNRPLLDLYRETTQALKEQMAEQGILTPPPRESLKVLPVPRFLRHLFPTAAYSAAGPFAQRQVGIFWVNDLSLLATTESKKRAEIRQHFGLPLTCVHEAYPGHHLQFSIQYQLPSRIRRLADHAIFYEGWTLWCEKMCVETGLVEMPYARLLQLQDALWRANRILIDCGLQCGQMTVPQAVTMLVKNVSFTKARAQGDVNWYTSAPTVPMSYLLGRLELERLHAYFVGSQGWSLHQFHDWVLSHGAIPWRWIWHAHLQREGEKKGSKK